ncbi:corrinoid protein [Candidatus Sumerlaeota bacterium]|nr:corrinoid protein [Candidatus Sumerlaeota bacterium]
MVDELLKTIADRVIVGRAHAASPHPPELAGQPGVRELVEEAIAKGGDAQVILQQGLLAGMEVVGQRFRDCEIFIPDVLASCQAMRAGSELLRPLLQEGDASPRGKFIIGTVKGDLHDIGKNLVAMMLEGAGFEVIDLGTNVSAEKFIEIAREHPGVPIGLSALLSTTMASMQTTVKALLGADLPQAPVTVVGGAPVTQQFADEIGANGYAADASSAVDVVKRLVEQTAV